MPMMICEWLCNKTEMPFSVSAGSTPRSLAVPAARCSLRLHSASQRHTLFDSLLLPPSGKEIARSRIRLHTFRKDGIYGIFICLFLQPLQLFVPPQLSGHIEPGTGTGCAFAEPSVKCAASTPNYYPGRHCAPPDVLWLKVHLPQDFPVSLAFRLFPGSGCILLFAFYLLLRFQLLAAHLGKIGLMANLPSMFRFFLTAVSRTLSAALFLESRRVFSAPRAPAAACLRDSDFLASHRLHPFTSPALSVNFVVIIGTVPDRSGNDQRTAKSHFRRTAVLRLRRSESHRTAGAG